ncbi:MAG: flagellar basal body L-ring protein FlgH [Bryobacteraceae bacterium]|nr:flagellar basal body L-ring protein FlgH [Bryobacteraceae bacterium]
MSIPRVLVSPIAAVALLAAERPPTRIERYSAEAEAHAVSSGAAASPGSLYSHRSLLADVARDLRASQAGDLVTIVVSDKASAIARGVTNTNRKSNANTSITQLLGITRATGPLANVIGTNSSQQLQGQGETSRETVLTTTLSARVTHVMPNGYLVLEGEKQILVNAERQVVTVRGVCRWNDVSTGNLVRSDRLAELEILVNGRGVVGDAIKRPFFLYRILLGLLPF